MSTATYDSDQPRRPTREQGLRIAARRKAARRRRTSRIRKAVVTVAVAAFLGPFAVIYTQLANGKDPALAATNAVVATAGASGSTGSGSAATGSTSTGSTSGSSGSSSTSAAPLTTQQS
jgi:hypothetical protein